jgi:hypothetical protein
MFAKCLGAVIRYHMTTVEREPGGRFKKGVVANPFGGMPRAKVMALKKLEGLTGKAIARLEKLIEDPNGSVAIAAVREVLDRNLGKVKQSVTVDVTSTHVLHLEALQFLAQKKRDQLQVIDNTANTVSHSSNATLDRIGLHGDSTLALSVGDYSVSMGDAEPPRPPDDRGAAAYAPTTPDTHENPTAPQDDTP